MTNKNKKHRTVEAKAAQESRRQALKDKAEKEAKLVSAPLVETNPYEKATFSKGQFNALILLGIGANKLFNLSKSIRVGEEPTKLCTEYFVDEIACTDDSVNTFLRYKLMLSVQVFLIVSTIILQCWRSEEVLLRFGGALLASPVFAVCMAFLLNDQTINQRTAFYRDIVMAFVLTAVAMPSKDYFPFLTGKKQSNNTFQSLSVLVISCFYFFEMFQWASTLFQSGAQGMAEALLTPSFLATLDSNVLPAMGTISHFYLIDKLTMAVSLFFAWFYLNEIHHRVRFKLNLFFKKMGCISLYLPLVFRCCN